MNNLVKYILTYCTEITILAFYLKLDPNDILHCITHNSKICNPLRVDNNPSMGFKYVQSGTTVKLKCRDFAYDKYSGDFIDIVGIVLSKNCNKKEDFIYILKHIIENVVHANVIDNYNIIPVKSSSYFKIEFELRKWLYYDYQYWLQYQVPIHYIKQYVFPIHNAKGIYKYSDNRIYAYNEDDACYVYKQTVIKDKTITKLYFPFRIKKDERGRFHTNNINILPFDCITHLRYTGTLVIIKAYKDYILLQYCIEQLGLDIDVIPISSENDVITDKYANYFNKTYNEVYTLFDFDRQGITLSNKYRKKYNFKNIFITNGRFNTVDYECKDFAELLTKMDLYIILDLIKSYDERRTKTTI